MPYETFKNLLKLAEKMQGSGWFTMDDIMDLYDESRPITRRTVERMREAISDYFKFDFEEEWDGPRKRYRLKSRRLDALTIASLSSFNEAELAAFPMAIENLRRNNLGPQAETLERAFIGLKSLRQPELRFKINLEDEMKSEGLAMRPGPRLLGNEAFVGTLREALRSFRQVKIAYLGRGGRLRDDYTLIPLGFLYGERQHYLVARHADGYPDGQPHNFILGNIKAVEVLGATFKEDPNFSLAEYAARSFGVYQEPPFEVEWRFSPQAAAEAANYQFHLSQEMEPQADGGLIVRFTAGGRREMA
jgi:hypothetical protein